MTDEEIGVIEERVNRKLIWLPRLLLAVVCVILVLSVTSVVITYGTATSTDAVNRGNELRECTTKESAKVTAAQTALIRAGQARDSATQEYLQAVAEDDEATATRLLTIAPDLRAKVATFSAELDDANAHFQAKLVQSRQHPDQFVAECADDE